MTKYHVKLDGTPGICRAKSGNCPLGGDNEHYLTEAAAQRAAQQEMEKEFGVGFEEPYGITPIVNGGKPSQYDIALLKKINLDGVTLSKEGGVGETTRFVVKDGTKEITFYESTEKGDSVTNYLTNSYPEQKWTVQTETGSTIMNDDQLSKHIGKLKDKPRLEEVTRRALKQWQSMPYNDPKARNIQKRIRQNEKVLGKTINTKLEDKAWSNESNDRVMAAESGYELDQLVDDDNNFVRAAVASNKYGLNELKSDKDPMVRAVVADQGYALDELINDEDPQVRAAVAHQGYGSNVLKDDPDPKVRMGVAATGNSLDTLMKDKDPRVRFAVVKAVAPGRYGKDLFINDESPVIRKHLAEQGIGIDTLINDEDPQVRTAAEKYKG